MTRLAMPASLRRSYRRDGSIRASELATSGSQHSLGDPAPWGDALGQVRTHALSIHVRSSYSTSTCSDMLIYVRFRKLWFIGRKIKVNPFVSTRSQNGLTSATVNNMFTVAQDELSGGGLIRRT